MSIVFFYDLRAHHLPAGPIGAWPYQQCRGLQTEAAAHAPGPISPEAIASCVLTLSLHYH